MKKRRTFIKEMASLGIFYPLIKTGSPGDFLSIGKDRHIVCIGAHPDDPESGCGGTLALHANAGNKISIVYLTKGEAGIPGKSHDEAALIRTMEAKAACEIIGAQPYFFGQIDGDTHFSQPEIKRMHDLLLKLKPDVIFTHWPIDSHPDHQVASLLSYQCWLRMGRSFEMYYFEVDGGYQTMHFNPTDYTDITSVSDQKKKALFQHASQQPDEIYFKHHLIMQQYRGREINVKEAEAFIRLDAVKQQLSSKNI